MVNEQTKIVTVDLPPGRDWELYADANVVALAPHLDQYGQDRALHEVCVHWRRSLLHVVPAIGVTA